jgi:Tfp pilus assembly protein PilO
MEKTKSLQVIVLISVLALLVSLILIIFYIVPNVSSLRDLSNQVLSKQQELEAGKSKVAAIRRAVQTINSAKRDVETLGIAIPSSPSPELALIQLSSAASQAGITITSASIGQAEKGYQNISFSTSGKFENTLSFLEKIEKNLRPVKINNYTINSVERSSDLSATFTFAFPYIEKQAAATATAVSSQEGGE